MILVGKGATAVGLGGAVLVSFGAFGAGATLRHDPVLSGRLVGDVLSWHGRMVPPAVLSLGLALMLPAWVRLGHSVRAGRASGREVMWPASLWCVPLLCAPPLFSPDLYTSLAQGGVAHAGLD